VTVAVTVPPNAHGTVRLPAATLGGVTDAGVGVASAPGVKAAVQEGEDVVVEVGSGGYRFAYDGAALVTRMNPPARFSTRTTVEDLLASAPARAVLDKRVPGFTTDARVQQALKMSLRDIAPYAPAVFTEDLLKALDDDLAAIP
jgi:hypothetical protein